MPQFNLKNIRQWLTDIEPPQRIVSSFLIIIAIGTMLLLFPGAAREKPLRFIDALFTAVSATCVTGLSVIDIGRDLTLFGQLVTLVLMQVGGLGVMTFSTFFLYMLRGRLSLMDTEVMNATLGQTAAPTIRDVLRKIMIIVFAIEGVGALILTFFFLRDYPLPGALWRAVYHSVSAFCNCGFSLFSDSFESYSAEPVLNIVIILLIIAGGLGFVVLIDFANLFRRRFRRVNRFTFHTRVVLMMTASLLITGTVLILLLEYRNIFAGKGWAYRLLASFFQSVTARTAGFSTLYIGSLTNGTCFVLMLLMFIGAAPGSCAGGVKVTTLGILLTTFISRISGSEEPHLFHRSIGSENVSRALTIVLSAAALIGAVFLGLLITEHGHLTVLESRGEFVELLFETISAFGTVGLSMGTTPGLTDAGRFLVVVLMFIGRLGPLTIAISLRASKKSGKISMARGDIILG